MNTPQQITISVRDYAGTYEAKCRTHKLRASCTMGPIQAAKACACKLWPDGAFSLATLALGSYVAIRTDPALHKQALQAEACAREQAPRAAQAKPATHWHKDKPDADIRVLIRVDSPDYPLAVGFTDGSVWHFDDGFSVAGTVLGWLDLDDAAALLDAASTVDRPAVPTPAR
jgi:hypothetical protein